MKSQLEIGILAWLTSHSMNPTDGRTEGWWHERMNGRTDGRFLEPANALSTRNEKAQQYNEVNFDSHIQA